MNPTPPALSAEGSPPRPVGVRFVVYSLLLFASWNHNLLGIPDGVYWSRSEPRIGYLGSESHLVVCRLAHLDLHPFYPLAGQTPDGGFVPYPSQVGLTGIGLSTAKSLTGAPASLFAELAGALFALLTASVVGAVLATAHRWLGPPTGDVACTILASVPVFLPFATSLYWVPWLLLAPFAVVWFFYPWANTPRRRALVVGGVGLAVLAKSLCGYEYITAVILAPVAAAWFHQHRAAESMFRRVRVAGVLIGVGLLGFALAMALHVGQQGVVLGQDGIEVIRNRAVTRTTGNPEGEARLGGTWEGESRMSFAIKCFLEYFDQRAVSVAGGFGRVRKDIPLKGVIAGAVVFALATALARRRWPREAGALGGAVILGLGASVSWQVLAVNHMCVHLHLNLIVFCVPFLLLASIAAGYMVRLTVGLNLGNCCGRILLVVVATVMAVNGWTDFRRRVAESADQAAAEAAVAARLGEPIPGPGDGLGGAVDSIKVAVAVPPTLLIEYGLIDPTTGNPVDPGALVVTGWALGDTRITASPTTRVVVACGNAVVSCRVLRFRRPDIEQLLNRPVAGTGYVAVIPSSALRPGEPVRVFVVPTADPTRAAELVVKRE